MSTLKKYDPSYEQKTPWAKEGWCSTDAYYEHWGNIFSNTLNHYFHDKNVIDVGTGNGIIWEKALETIRPKTLTLIDPDLCISTSLANMDFVLPHRCTVDEVGAIHGDTVVFKQAFHLAYEHSGLKLFDLLKADSFINFALHPDVDWPISQNFRDVFVPTCPDVRKIIDEAGLKIRHSQFFTYPVEMTQDEWISMVKGRFISCLHNCDDDFIAHEVKWIKDNLPKEIRFSDPLECLVFGP